MRWRLRRPIYTRHDAAVGAVWGGGAGLTAGLVLGWVSSKVSIVAAGTAGAIGGAVVGATLVPIALACIGAAVGYAVAAAWFADVPNGRQIGAAAGAAGTLVLFLALAIRALERSPARAYPGLDDRRPPERAPRDSRPERPRREREIEIRLEPPSGQRANAAPTCPYCLTEIGADEETRVCPRCQTVHHRECWRENSGCTVFGCTAAPHR
jgi:hypothetical protein